MQLPCASLRRIGQVWQARPRRVTVLLAGIAVLSLADLAVTIAYLQANSMMEANPLAAYVIRATQSVWVLVAFKLATVAVCVGLLYRVRRHLCGEVAAWCALAILAAISVMWHSYSNQIEGMEEVMLAQITMGDDDLLGLP